MKFASFLFTMVGTNVQVGGLEFMGWAGLFVLDWVQNAFNFFGLSFSASVNLSV